MKWLKELFLSKCECGGRIHYFGDDWTGRVWISVYKCDACQKEFI